MIKTALSIAGSDCSGGAGIAADIKTMSALNVYAMCVITSVVAENTCGVIAQKDVPASLIRAQIDAVMNDIPPSEVKVGMLYSRSTIEAVADALSFYDVKAVVDPVMYAKDGSPLMDEDSVGLYIKRMIPLSKVFTPNIPEAESISGIKIKSDKDIIDAAKIIYDKGATNVLIKGGHRDGAPIDVLFDGKKFDYFEGKRIQTKNTHGTGCTLSSAIAAFLALGESVVDAVFKAKKYIAGAIENALPLGKGCGPLDHFYGFRSKHED